MASTIECGDPFTRATRGFLNKDGSCGTPISIGGRGYLIEITEDGEGGYIIERKGGPKGLTGMGGVLPLPVRPISHELLLEEDYEIVTLIGIFLQHIGNGRII